MGYHGLPDPRTTRTLKLVDVGDTDLHVVAIANTHGHRFTECRSVSLRLPPEFLSLFDESGVVSVSDLTPEETEWIAAEDPRFDEVAA